MLLLFFTPALHGGLGLDTGAKKTKAKKNAAQGSVADQARGAVLTA